MCKARIERNLGLSKGVKESNLDLNDKVVTVKYNPDKTTEAAIKATINNTGYDADLSLQIKRRTINYQAAAGKQLRHIDNQTLNL
jgi:copper chaperone CopZ